MISKDPGRIPQCNALPISFVPVAAELILLVVVSITYNYLV